MLGLQYSQRVDKSLGWVDDFKSYGGKAQTIEFNYGKVGFQFSIRMEPKTVTLPNGTQTQIPSPGGTIVDEVKKVNY